MGTRVVSQRTLIILVLIGLFLPALAAAQTYTLPNNNPQDIQMNVVHMDALGINPPTGLITDRIALANGALYYFRYTINVSQMLFNWGQLSTTVEDNFNNAGLVLRHCPSGSDCTSAASYTNTPVGSSATLASNVGVGNYTVGIAVFIPTSTGPAINSDSAVVQVNLTIFGFQTGRLRFIFTNVGVQTAVQLELTPDPLGLSFAGGTTYDYIMNFGNVNGLGIGATTGGLTVVPGAGGVYYSTPYALNPKFSHGGSATGTISAQVSSNFAVLPTILSLHTSTTGAAGSFTPIQLAGNWTTFGSYNSGALVPRYLGLFVTTGNAPGLPRSDAAILTHRLVVP